MEKERKYTELKRLKKFLKRKNITYNKLSKILDISLDAVNNKLKRVYRNDGSGNEHYYL